MDRQESVACHLRRLRSVIVGLTTAGLAVGCVTTGTHEALQKQCAEQDAAHQEQHEKLLGANESLATDLASTTLQLEDSNAQYEKSREDLAVMMKDRSRLEASVEDMQSALAELEERRREAEARMAEFRQLVERFKDLIDTGKLEVKMVDGRMVLALATDILFGSGSAKLSKEGKEAIAQVASVLASVEGRRFQIEGHTDDVPIKTQLFPSNWELASRRAVHVVKAMIEAGMPAERVSSAGFAEYRPATSNETAEGRAQNRRIEIVVVPDLSSLPGFEALNEAASAES